MVAVVAEAVALFRVDETMTEMKSMVVVVEVVAMGGWHNRNTIRGSVDGGINSW